ncbi:neural cell adhesion molecule 2-like [Toxorhynchites rutilus septentrionalis]|uniref:neural cell adhesion molecule 2-like n=1 Tax=Toxorhynchites rutilus septentrionalis TaxID=329112 RepID=UPI00247861E6|nr:neural cell adhesion molecule 2-like [Toxorhynchites rutilus septentrionalis]XP_055641303.1 neural cell adhesion molecule 2-like [Toxorhynchites rutilus septentrionalis]
MASLRITMTRMHFGLNFIILIIVSSIYGNHTLDSEKGSGGRSSAASTSENQPNADPTAATLALIPDEEIAHFVNQSRMVSCRFSDPDVKLKWRNPKNGVVTETKGRVHIEELGGSLTLIFESIVRADQGNWTCEADDRGTIRKKSFKMIVNEPISFRDTRTMQTAMEDKDATIRCEVRGHPEPTVSWYFNGQPLSPPTSKYTMLADGLLIKKVLKKDGGEYTCKAFQVSTAGSSFEEKTIRLNIRHKPYIPDYSRGNVTYGYVGGAVNLSCDAVAEPPANFTWSSNNKKFSHKNHLIYGGQHVSMLQITIKNSTAFGKYKCEAKNELGTISREIQLKEGTKPDPPSRFQLRGVNSDTLDIDVGATKSHDVAPDPTTVIGYRFELIPTAEFAKHRNWDRANRRDFDVADGVTYLLVHLIPDTKYLIRVASRNAAGLSDWTEVKEFSTHALQPHGFNSGANSGHGDSFRSPAATMMALMLMVLVLSTVGVKLKF